MRKAQVVMLLMMLIVLTGCKETKDIPRDNGVDDYIMEVTIMNEEDYHIKGEIQYHSQNDLSELYLMMFANTHIEGDDRVLVNSIQVNGEDVTYGFEGEDMSALHLELNQNIEEGDLVTIEYDMDVEYPDTFRLVHYGETLYQMYFYPYVAIYQDGFDIDPYSQRGESYYNVLSDYDVTITLENDFIVAAPGELVEKDKDKELTSHRYLLENARDFSFSASTEYEVYTWKFDGDEYEIYSIRPLNSEELGRTKQYTEQSLDIFDRELGEYYFDRIVLELGYIYGMESSGIIYCSEEISEGTIVHEMLHQWFFFMVGNDPFDESFLDESITTYMSSMYYYELYGMAGYNGNLDYRDSSQERLSERWDEYQGRSLLETPDEMGDGYGFMIYYHGVSLIREYVLSFMDNDVDAFYAIMRDYFEMYNGEIATIDEFLTFLEEESGVDETIEWFLFHLNELQDVKNTPQ